MNLLRHLPETIWFAVTSLQSQDGDYLKKKKKKYYIDFRTGLKWEIYCGDEIFTSLTKIFPAHE